MQETKISSKKQKIEGRYIFKKEKKTLTEWKWTVQTIWQFKIITKLIDYLSRKQDNEAFVHKLWFSVGKHMFFNGEKLTKSISMVIPGEPKKSSNVWSGIKYELINVWKIL